jgi:hypothetical protein
MSILSFDMILSVNIVIDKSNNWTQKIATLSCGKNNFDNILSSFIS